MLSLSRFMPSFLTSLFPVLPGGHPPRVDGARADPAVAAVQAGLQPGRAAGDVSACASLAVPGGAAPSCGEEGLVVPLWGGTILRHLHLRHHNRIGNAVPDSAAPPTVAHAADRKRIGNAATSCRVTLLESSS